MWEYEIVSCRYRFAPGAPRKSITGSLAPDCSHLPPGSCKNDGMDVLSALLMNQARPQRGSARAVARMSYLSVNISSIDSNTSIGSPTLVPGVNFHCRAALIAS